MKNKPENIFSYKLSLYLHMKAFNAAQEELFRIIPSRNVKHYFITKFIILLLFYI